MSGYDIRRSIAGSIGHFWSESYGQIYPGLKRLAAGGLVEKKTERTKGRPDRHLYSLTDEGRERLHEWLKMPVNIEVPRIELLLKLFFGAEAPVEVSREHVTRYMEAHEGTLKVYAQIAKKLRKDEAKNPQLPYWLMTLNYGRLSSTALVKWCRETLKELDELEAKQRRRK